MYPPDDTALDVHEAAVLLRVHPMTIRRLIQRGQLPAAKVGARYRIKRSHVESMLAQA